MPKRRCPPDAFRCLTFLGLLFAGAFHGECAPVPPPPRILLAAPGDAQVTLEWAPTAGASGYDVWRSASENGALVPVVGDLPATRFVVSNLNNNINVFFAVSAHSPQGAGAPSQRVRAIPSVAVLDLLPAGAKVEKLAAGFQFIEGPVWMPGGFLVFSDIQANRLYRWTPGEGRAVFRTNSGQANGNTLDREGRLVSGEHANRRVSRTEPDGTITALATHYNGQPFNAPNDVVVKSDGSIWFTDPNYGSGARQPKRFVFRFHPTNVMETLITVATNFDQPNGLCFSPDEKRLYIADSGTPHHVRVFDVEPDNTLTHSRVFTVINAGVPDGMRNDSAGRLFVSTGEGIHVFSPEGLLLGKIRTPETAANVAFGGPEGTALFITANTSLYGISRLPDLVVTGVKPSGALVEGRELGFHVMVKNQGTAPVAAGEGLRVVLSLDGVIRRFQTPPFSLALPADALVSVFCDAGGAPTTWKAVAGSHTILATVDDLGRVAESIETNNTLTNRFTVAAAPPDTDGDGANDEDEGVAGTNPMDPASALRIVSGESQRDGSLVLTWTSAVGKAYRVTCQGLLGSPDWLDASETMTASALQTSWTNPPGELSGPLFLRVRVVP